MFHTRTFLLRLLLVVVLVGLFTVVGTVGYMLVEGWNLADSLYMTSITLTSVGFEEVHPLSPQGMLFTEFLLVAQVVILGIWFAIIAALIVQLDLTNVLRLRKRMKALQTIEDHVIVCGAGRTGRQVIQEFMDLGQPFVAIEGSQQRIDDLHEEFPGILLIHGDATHDDKLEEAGIERATALVTCLSADADNLFVCISARELRPDIMIVARGYEEDTMSKLYRAGADHVISPNVSGAIQMASFVLRPSVMTFLDVATRSPDLALRLEEAVVHEGSKLADKTLAEAQIPQRTGLIVIAMKKRNAPSHEFVFNPVASSRLEAGDTLVALGTPEQLVDLRAYVGE